MSNLIFRKDGTGLIPMSILFNQNWFTAFPHQKVWLLLAAEAAEWGQQEGQSA